MTTSKWASHPRKYLKCNECGRVIVEWERVAHWQTHRNGWSPSPAPRDELAAMFEEAGEQ